METPLRTDGGLMDRAARRDESRNRGICRRIMLRECCLRRDEDEGDARKDKTMNVWFDFVGIVRRLGL